MPTETTSRIRPQTIAEWERAEVERSAHEAARDSDARLRVAPSDARRYRSPSADTSFPLEYAYFLLGDVSGKVIVDFGCGWGENTPHLCGRQATVISFDISNALLQRARRRLSINAVDEQAHLVAASAHDLPFEPGSVDVIFGIAILHHLDLQQVAREIKRVLKVGGRAIFQEPVRNSRLLRSARRLIPSRDPEVSPFERPLLDEELRNFGTAAGLSLRRSRAFVLPHIPLSRFIPFLRRRTDACYRIDGTLLRRFPLLERYAAVRVIEWVRTE